MGRRAFGSIRKLPSGRWQARYPDVTGDLLPAPRTFTTKAEAGQWLATVEADRARGQYLDPRAGQITLTDWAEQWLSSSPGKRPTTLARDRQALETHFLPTLGKYPLAAITPMHIRQVVDPMKPRLAPATIVTVVGVLKAVMNAAVEADLIARSPVRGLRLPGRQPPLRVTLTEAELDRLADAVPPRYRCVILTLGVLGLRWSELVGLRIGDVDFLRRQLTIAQTVAEVEGRQMVAATKSRAGRRTMTVPAVLIEDLAQHVQRFRPNADPTDALFVGPHGGLLRRTFCARHFRPAAERVGLDPSLTIHGLRHVATSLMVASGEHPRVIQARLGHATARLSMELYAHVPDEADRRAAEHLDARLRAARGDDIDRQSEG